MRQAKFRGLSAKGEWVHGSLVIAEACLANKRGQHTKTWIVTSAFGNGGWFNIRGRQYVKPNTVGQYTEKKDKNNIDIYDGDVCVNESGRKAVCIYDTGNASFDFVATNIIGDNKGFESHMWGYRLIVVGNIHDNPDLLGDNDE